MFVISILFNARVQATSSGTGWLLLAPPLHDFSALRQSKDKQISEERSKAMKIKTNVQAGFAVWGG